LTAQTVVVKIGGSTLGHHDTSLEDLVAIQQRGVRPVVVHGGGAEITKWLASLGLKSSFVDGLRVTGAEELQVVTAVLSGLVNKSLVLELQSRGARAVGLSGADGSIVRAVVSRPSLGFVGDIRTVDASLIVTLLDAGYLPIISPVSWGTAGDGASLLNVNADDVAAEIAVALSASSLVFLTDVPGILDENGRLVSSADTKRVEEMITLGVIRGGMLPKARACMRASRSVARTRIIDGTAAHALLNEFEQNPGGTTIVR
jgi:acetylglutamate kinase